MAKVIIAIPRPKFPLGQIVITANADGRLEGDPREGRARPVYYTLYQWE